MAERDVALSAAQQDRNPGNLDGAAAASSSQQQQLRGDFEGTRRVRDALKARLTEPLKDFGSMAQNHKERDARAKNLGE